MIKRFLAWLNRPCKTMCSNPRCIVCCMKAAGQIPKEGMDL